MIVRTGYLLLGHLSVAAGVVGLLLPLVPSTPFVLLAALCYSRGSDRFHRWIHRHRLFGRMLRDWQDGGAIAPLAKAAACLGFAGSVVLAWIRLGPLWGITAILVAATGIAFILSRPSRSPVAVVETDEGRGPNQGSIPPVVPRCDRSPAHPPGRHPIAENDSSSPRRTTWRSPSPATIESDGTQVRAGR